ncbi:MAG: hypothetical protein EBU90_18560 [Proteobacteria bacterium]|jgi:small-conductance mechanosensitive channel|nr:hypothetical protein [Pseudomonadota bacterium]NBP14002.1 hypothetical protein [bacterium]
MKTFGERLVCTETDNERVQNIQKALAAVADMLKDHMIETREKVSITNMGADLFSQAIGQIVLTELLATKVITFIDEPTSISKFGDLE